MQAEAADGIEGDEGIGTAAVLVQVAGLPFGLDAQVIGFFGAPGISFSLLRLAGAETDLPGEKNGGAELVVQVRRALPDQPAERGVHFRGGEVGPGNGPEPLGIPDGRPDAFCLHALCRAGDGRQP